jgi:formamidopyrimidine-DNA glycosylase
MPEVVEVLKTVDFLKKVMKNEFITDIKILKGRYITHGPFDSYSVFKKNLPLKVIDIKNKGKFIYFILEKGFYLFSTLGLKGGWCYSINNTFRFPKLIDYINDISLSKYRKIQLNNLNVSFHISNGKIIYYTDSLSFGTLKIVFKENDVIKKLDSLGPDIMYISFDLFKERILRNINLEKYIANVIMNQKNISGIGNYLRSDILWLSKISPLRKVKDLTDKDIKRLFNSAKILTWGQYDFKKGVRLGWIKSSDKIPEYYGRNFFAYMCDTDIYGNKIVLNKEIDKERTIYWVPDRQI